MQSQEDDDPLSNSYSLNDIDINQLFDGNYHTFISEQSRELKKCNDKMKSERKSGENQEPSNNSDETK